MKKQSIILFWILGVPVVAVLGFVLLHALFYQEPAEKFQHDGNVAELLSEVQRLENDLSNHPEQPEKQLVLAHSYHVMGKYPAAIKAYGKAWEIVESSPTELVRFTEALFRQKGSQFDEQTIGLINQALAIDHHHIDALILRGTAMLQQKNNHQAMKDWTLASSLLPETDGRKAELTKMMQAISP